MKIHRTSKFLLLLVLSAGLAAACTAPKPTPAPPPPARTSQPPRLLPTLYPTPIPTDSARPLQRPAQPQLGLNFIRFYFPDPRTPNQLDTTTPYFQPDWIFRDFHELGVQAFRQFVRADLLWDVVEKKDNQWDFTAADSVIKNPDFEPVVTLFALQYASPTPPWETNPARFQKTLGPEAVNYLETVVRRYAPFVKYWELGNEMDHWRAYDPGDPGANREKGPAAAPAGGFSPSEQGAFLAQAAALIRKNDPDAVIVLPGFSGLDKYQTETWLAGVVAGGTRDWFDIINYHYYGPWERYSPLRTQAGEAFKSLGLDAKPVWLTETGATADPTLTLRTNYPNSPEVQAAEIFRRIVPAYGHGDALVMWHTYIGSVSDPNNDWRSYGIRTESGGAQPSLAAFRLLAAELIPFEKVEAVSRDPRGANVYRVTLKSRAVKYVVWGAGSFTVPAGMTGMVDTAFSQNGVYTWQPTRAGEAIRLAPYPVLVK